MWHFIGLHAMFLECNSHEVINIAITFLNQCLGGVSVLTGC